MPTPTPETIDMTPTWGEIGQLMIRLALSKETKAFKAGQSEVARAFAMAQAYTVLYNELTPEQRQRARAIIEREKAIGMRA